MNGGARASATDFVHETPVESRCSKDGCDAEVRTKIKKEDGESVEEKRCAKGHFVKKRTLDLDGSTFKAFKAILGP